MLPEDRRLILVSLGIVSIAACSDSPTAPPPHGLVLTPSLEVTPSALTNLPYATRSAAQKLDIYLPTSGVKPYPVVVWVHGGGWSTGDKTLGLNHPSRQLLSQGIAVVSINYRLSGEARFPAQIHDVKAALRWVRARASTYGFNPNRIGTWGLSAGGHLAALLGTSTGVATLTDLSLGNPTMSEQVKTVVVWAGPMNFLSMDGQLALNGCPLFNGTGHNAANSPESLLLGAPITTIPTLVSAASPRAYVTLGDPKFLVQHGKLDCTVPYQQADGLVNRIRNVLGSAQVQYDLFPTGKHGGPEFTGSTNVTRVVNYIKATL
jgi:acetyl esterase/lipase